MGYYIRILTPKREPVPMPELTGKLPPGATVEVAGHDEGWKQLVAKSSTGRPIVHLERNQSSTDALVAEEMAEFVEAVEGCKPKAAAAWLQAYLGTVNTIYALQILGPAYQDGNWAVVDALRDAIWLGAGGIVQADGEGFSNENGDHILWQFDADVSGDCTMAVLSPRGAWERFVMDLGDPGQREAFLQGRVPARARRLG